MRRTRTIWPTERENDNEMLQWLHSTGELPTTLADTLDCINPTLYRNVNTILTIVTMPVSTATPERSFNTMRKVKIDLRATMKAERLSALALMHAYKDNNWRGGHNSWVLRQEEQDAKLRIPVKLELRYLASWTFSPVQFVITSRLVAENLWCEDIF